MLIWFLKKAMIIVKIGIEIEIIEALNALEYLKPSINRSCPANKEKIPINKYLFLNKSFKEKDFLVCKRDEMPKSMLPPKRKRKNVKVKGSMTLKTYFEVTKLIPNNIWISIIAMKTGINFSFGRFRKSMRNYFFHLSQKVGFLTTSTRSNLFQVKKYLLLL